MPGFGASYPLLAATFPTISTTEGRCITIGDSQSSLPAARAKDILDRRSERVGMGKNFMDSATVAGQLKICSRCCPMALSDWMAADHGSVGEHGCPCTRVRAI
ncbi:hypothetical protein M441DRAFT_278408 [Trichoderma asperellum CBS 433.97]|uniref:Uncharacterized protein n=1 Tax=Trichoderma asperellum (strain ATCC 204424 / CBS 433.97 / NBRC 101777) TaxID=1042311 RepID=A0A2T3YV57_TRIA4|nr:hypothetical protein M441DRAFT_278408 [Trichoderma asperellum CBS 433.97]PTB36407.1 hypothetical protein M441DRAFT_278408 [Trichoderma asperellum CBS 433.97]